MVSSYIRKPQFYPVDTYYFKTYKMKKSILSLLIGGGVILSLLSGCQTETMPKTFASVAKVSPDMMSAEVTLKTQGLSEYAYLSYPSSQTPVEDPQVIFATGTVGQLVDGDNTFVIRDFEPESDYTVIFAFKKGLDTFYERNVTIDVRTADYVEVFTAVATYPDGLKFHIKVPQSVKDAGNALRYNVGSLPFYLNSKYGWFASEDARSLIENDQKCTTEDITLLYNSDNVEIEVEDPWTGEMIPDMLHSPFVPGEPIVFTAGEFALGEPEENPWGMNQADYFVPLFDYEAYWEYLDNQGGGWGPLAVEVDGEGFDEDQFWTGYFTRRYVTITPPAALDANVDIKAEMGAVKGTITITPDNNVYQYCFMVLDEGTYQMLLPYIDNNEDYLQWLVTSWFGMYQGAQTMQGPVKVDLKELFYYVEPETDFHVLLTAMGDETGMTQKFYHEIFSTTAKTMPAPKVEVKAINNPNTSEASPYEVWFNVKCTSKNAVSVKYAANYEREFGMMINSGYTYDNLVEMGNSFSSDEVALINSDEGLNVMYSSMPDATTVLAVLAYNEEDAPNTIGDGAGSSAVASATSLREPDKAKVESPLFTALLGDWTMSAPTRGTNYYYENYDGGIRNTKVSISTGFTYPETLPESVYDTYKELVGMEREEVDALYDEFKQEVDEFNAKLKGQNRLLCLGFGYDYEQSSNHWATSYFTPESAFDLFCSKSYNGYDNESMLWDCGPKWYLEIKEDGSVVAPIHMGRMYPMKSTSSNVYLFAVDRSEESKGYLPYGPDAENLEFPVSVSEDNNTIIVNPYDYSGVSYYAEAMTLTNYGYAQYAGYEIDGVPTLTKGWTETASVKSASKPTDFAPEFERNSLKPAGATPKTNFTAKSKTAFGAMKKYQTVTAKKVDVEEGMKKYIESYAAKR